MIDDTFGRSLAASKLKLYFTVIGTTMINYNLQTLNVSISLLQRVAAKSLFYNSFIENFFKKCCYER